MLKAQNINKHVSSFINKLRLLAHHVYGVKRVSYPGITISKEEGPENMISSARESASAPRELLRVGLCITL